MIAAMNGHVEIVRLLLDHGADINTGDPWLGQTALHLASELRVVEMLLEKSAAVNASAHNGDKPLHAAVRSRLEGKVAMLLKHGASVDSQNAMKHKPIHVLLDQSNGARRVAEDIAVCNDMAQSLVCHGAEWDAVCDELINEKDNVSLSFRVALQWWMKEHARGVEELTNIPEELFLRGPSSVQHYVQACGASSKIILRRNVCVVGPSGSGKTSLVISISEGRSTLESQKTAGTGADELSISYSKRGLTKRMLFLDDRRIGCNQFSLSVSERTSGEKNNAVKVEERAQPQHLREDRDVSFEPSGVTTEREIHRHHDVVFWDFGGQEAYQIAQSALFFKRTLYLVCVDLQAYVTALEQSELRANSDNDVERFMGEFVETNVLRWVRLILARQPNAEFVFAGTKVDALVRKHLRIKVREDLKNRVIVVAHSIQRHSCDSDKRIGPIHLRSAPATSSKAVDQRCSLALIASAKRLHNLDWLEVNCKDSASVEMARIELEQIIVRNKRSFQIPELYSQALDIILNRRDLVAARPSDQVAETFLTIAQMSAIIRTKLPDQTHNLSDAACQTILRTLHDLGDVLWFEDVDIEYLKNTVILDPLFLIELAHELVNHNNIGEVTHATLKEKPMWCDLDPGRMLAMKQLLQHLRLAVSTGAKMKLDSDMIVSTYRRSEESASWFFLNDVVGNKSAAMKLENVCVRWQYNFTTAQADVVFAELVIESYLGAYERLTGPNWILYNVDKQFVCCVVVTRGHRTVRRVLRVEAIASKSAEGTVWKCFEHLCDSLEKVLSRYDALVVSRHAVNHEAQVKTVAGRLPSDSSGTEREQGQHRCPVTATTEVETKDERQKEEMKEKEEKEVEAGEDDWEEPDEGKKEELEEDKEEGEQEKRMETMCMVPEEATQANLLIAANTGDVATVRTPFEVRVGDDQEDLRYLVPISEPFGGATTRSEHDRAPMDEGSVGVDSHKTGRDEGRGTERWSWQMLAGAREESTVCSSLELRDQYSDGHKTYRGNARDLEPSAWPWSSKKNKKNNILSAAEEGDVETVNALLKAGNVELEAHDTDRWTPLHHASWNGHIQVVEMLLKASATVDATNNLQETPLHGACRRRQSNVVRMLLLSGANVHAKDKDGLEPLHGLLRTCEPTRVEPKTLDTLQVLVAFGATWDAKCDEIVAAGQDSRKAPALAVCMSLWAQEIVDGNSFTDIPVQAIRRGTESTQAYIDSLKISPLARIFTDTDTARRVVSKGLDTHETPIGSVMTPQPKCVSTDDSATNVLRRKICVVGSSGAGKTSFVKSITTTKPQLVHFDNRTIGIDHFPLRFEQHGTKQKTIHEVTFWDFGGQDANQVAHSLFFSPRTLFLLCIDVGAFADAFLQASLMSSMKTQENQLMDEFIERTVTQWIRMIAAHQPEAEFVFIATKEDLIQKNKVTERLLKDALKAKLKDVEATAQDVRLKQKANEPSPSSVAGNVTRPNVVFVNCASSASVQSARAVVEDLIGKNDRSFEMPDSYTQALQAIAIMRHDAASHGITTRIDRVFTPVDTLSAKLKLEPDLCRRILQTLHDLGDVLWYEDLGIELFQCRVILDPLLLIDFIRQVIDHNYTGQTMPHSDLKALPYWNGFTDKDQMEAMKQLLQEFKVVYSADDDRTMRWDSDLIVPASWQTKTPAALLWLSDILRINPTKLGSRRARLSSSDMMGVNSTGPQDGEAVRVHWEFHFEFGLPSALFDQVVVASVSPFFTFDAGPDWIIYEKEDGTACRLMVGRDPISLHRTIHVEALAADVVSANQVKELWESFERLVSAFLGVLHEYPGLVVSSFAWDDMNNKIVFKRLMLSKTIASKWMPPSETWVSIRNLMMQPIH